VANAVGLGLIWPGRPGIAQQIGGLEKA